MRLLISGCFILLAACGGGGADPLGDRMGAEDPDHPMGTPAAAEPSLRWAGDAAVERGADASVTCTCGATGPCRTPACVEGECRPQPVEDGLSCDEAGDRLCVGGDCVAARCGDGYRDPGPGVDREGCDDGNELDGDLCHSCAPVVWPVASRADGWDETGPGRSIAHDGVGLALVVWVAQVGGTEPLLEIRARRLDRFGAPAGTLIVLACEIRLWWSPRPEVSGLAGGGWVVVWRAPSAFGRAVQARVTAAGDRSPVRPLEEDGAHPDGPVRVAPLEDGFVAVWETMEAMGRSIRARRFASSGRPLDDAFTVSSASAEYHVEPAVASSGSRWMVTWLAGDQPPSTEPPRVAARAFEGETPLGPVLEVTPESTSPPAVAALAGGDWAVVWTGRDDGAPTAVRARRIGASGEPLSDTVPVAFTEATARSPSVAGTSGDAFLVAWEQDSPARAGFARVDSTAFAPEDTDLAAVLGAPGFRGGLALSQSPRGTWFTWNGRGAPANPDSHRSVFAFLLPPE